MTTVIQTDREQMNVVIVGHVDHGKSTLVGRLLADTGSLPKGKLEAVKVNCKRNAKPFEYAFLLDALKDEQSQGITIDTARCFFKSAKRDYIIIDAPGHIEFLKNMISGAARAEAAMLVIDAKEGIKENSKRHGYMMSFLGIKNVNICVNKMDLINYDEKAFLNIQKEFNQFLQEIGLKPLHYLPISAREGDNIVKLSKHMSWYKGLTVLEAFDHFEKAAPDDKRELRFPVQDIYKFTEKDDERRIVAGRVESGSVAVGDEVIFFPSKKTSRIASVEGFSMKMPREAFAGQSTGFTLETQIYIRSGELMAKVKERQPHVSNKFKANVFWMGKSPLVKGKNYKLKIATQQVPVLLAEILNVLDASELSSITNKQQVDRHDVAECIFETLKPIAFDEINQVASTGRFVIVDNYEIAGGGIILAPVFEGAGYLSKYIKEREYGWERSAIKPDNRLQKNKHKPLLVVITGPAETGKRELAKSLEENLFKLEKRVYFLGLSNDLLLQGAESNDKTLSRFQHIKQLGEMAHVLTDAGLILVTSLSDLDNDELEMLKTLNQPNRTLVVQIGGKEFSKENVNLSFEVPFQIQEVMEEVSSAVLKAIELDPEFNI